MNWNAVSPRLKAQAIEAAEATVLRAKGKQNAVPLPLDPGNGPRPELAARLAIESTATLARFVASIQAYRRHPYRRALNDPPSVWRSGQARLLDYGGGGETVLLVPSLINRPYILDLSERASFARWLSARNKRVLLLDWGWPDAAESRFDLGSYVTERLEPALAAAVEIGGGERVSVIGYCMGGTLAVPLAQRNAALIDKLVLLAAPWDFHAEARERALAAAAAFRAWEPLVAAMGILPLDAIETLFATLDPSLVLRKFLRFASLDAQSRAAEDFVALEDWVGDGVPLAAPAAADALVGWYGENRPALGAWRIGGAVIDPASIPNPVLAIVPTRDRIVPPESARALAKRVPQAHMHEVATGHVSLMVGSGAAETVWKPLISFLNG
jgi:poly(3-hydroxyalkanoate) synthetase